MRTVQNSREVFIVKTSKQLPEPEECIKRKDKRSVIVMETTPNVLVSFPNSSCWEHIVSLWSRICSPGTYRNDLFRWGRFGNELRHYGFIPVRCRNVCETFVERMWTICGTFVERMWNVCGTCVPLLFWHYNLYSEDGCLFKIEHLPEPKKDQECF